MNDAIIADRLIAENADLRAEVERLQGVINSRDAEGFAMLGDNMDLRAEVERLQHQLYVDITAEEENIKLQSQLDKLRALVAPMQAAMDKLHEQKAEIDRLRTQCGGNCRYWEGRWRDEAVEVDWLRAEFKRFMDVCAEGGTRGRAMDRIDARDWKRALRALEGK